VAAHRGNDCACNAKSARIMRIGTKRESPVGRSEHSSARCKIISAHHVAVQPQEGGTFHSIRTMASRLLGIQVVAPFGYVAERIEHPEIIRHGDAHWLRLTLG